MKCIIFLVNFYFNLVGIASCMKLSQGKPAYCNDSPHRAVIHPLNSNFEGSSAELIHATILHRHGDRAPCVAGQCWPKDDAVWHCELTTAQTTVTRYQTEVPVSHLFKKVYDDNKEQLPGNCAVGQLTTRGYNMLVRNGAMLRKEYLDTGFVTDLDADVLLRVDDVPRTIQSLQAMVEGMFALTSAGNASKVPAASIHMMDYAGDPIIIGDRLCKKAARYTKAYKNSAVWQAHYIEITRPLLKELAKLLDMDYVTMTDETIFGLTDCLLAHICFGYDYPSSLRDPDLYKRMVDEMMWLTMAKNAYPTPEEASRVRTGFLFKEWNDNIEQVMKGGDPKKLSIYSGHDSTVIAVLQALGWEEFPWPKYGFVLQLELYSIKSASSSSDGEYAFRLILDSVPTQMPFCPPSPDQLCPSKYYFEKMREITLSSAEQDSYCNSDVGSYA